MCQAPGLLGSVGHSCKASGEGDVHFLTSLSLGRCDVRNAGPRAGEPECWEERGLPRASSKPPTAQMLGETLALCKPCFFSEHRLMARLSGQDGGSCCLKGSWLCVTGLRSSFTGLSEHTLSLLPFVIAFIPETVYSFVLTSSYLPPLPGQGRDLVCPFTAVSLLQC